MAGEIITHLRNPGNLYRIPILQAITEEFYRRTGLI